MTLKPLVPRAAASQDVDAALDWYLAEAGEQVALGFIEALERSYAHIARYPASGSPRYAHALNIARLQSWGLDQYPYVVFYLERDTYVDVWRVLHGQRDIPAWMQAGGEGE